MRDRSPRFLIGVHLCAHLHLLCFWRNGVSQVSVSIEEPEYIGGHFMLRPALRALDRVAGTPSSILKMQSANQCRTCKELRTEQKARLHETAAPTYMTAR